VPLQECQLGAWAATARPRRARLLGAAPLPRSRGPVAGAAALGRLTWLVGELVASRVEAAGVKTLELAVPGWPGHRACQHADLRLTAEDGYQAVRSYSLAAPASDSTVELTVERLEDGEVSPYLVDEFRPGDMLELRGPIGGYFVWDPEDP